MKLSLNYREDFKDFITGFAEQIWKTCNNINT